MAEAPSFPHVFQPIRIGGLALKNRIFVPAHTTNFGESHRPSQRHLDYHRARARGGAAAIIFESIRVHKTSLGRPQGVGGYDPATIEIFARIAEAVHAEGVKLLGQVIHLGRQIEGDFERTVSWGPSGVRWSPLAAMPHAVTRDEMDEVIDGHVRTARNILAAGFDGFEVHLGHGHLLQQFLSPSSNQRRDDYGGSEEARQRFPLEVLKAVRAAVGPDICMGVRVSAEEYIEGGLHLDDMCRILPCIAGEVRLDFVNVSHSAYHASYSLATQMADMAFDRAQFRPLPAALRRAMRAAGHAMPIFAVCRFTTLAEAETSLADGAADMIGMARAHIADPEIVNKSRAGRIDEVRPCIGCNQGCAGMLEKNLAITCLVNPRAGLEGHWSEPEQDRASQRRRVLVVGGGPAGLEAAWVAAARGHQVTLWEQADWLGGQVNWIRQLPPRRELLTLLELQQTRCRRHGVDVVLGRRADVEAVAGLAPDVVVLAAGSIPTRLRLAEGGEALMMEEALADPARLGERVAFYDTIGEWSSVGTIEHLADLGKQVTVFTPIAGFGWRTTIYSSFATRQRLRERKVRIAPLRAVRAWRDFRLLVEDASTGESEWLAGFDSLVATHYNVSDDGLHAPLRARGLAVRMIGDCLAPRTALEAVFEGHAAARAI